ncbi:MAG: hypothetical protein IKF83_03755 [Clostridia bacterium]|nr:hypothetical protein [Clostridia bacterium]
MIVLIVTITIILYILLVVFSLHKLSFVNDIKVKIAYIATGLLIMYIITLIIFNISSNGINYENEEMIGKVRNMLLAVFIPVNGLLTMPYLASIIGKISTNEIAREKFNKKLIAFVILFIIILIIEYSYFKSTQQGIINMINNK